MGNGYGCLGGMYFIFYNCILDGYLYGDMYLMWIMRGIV